MAKTNTTTKSDKIVRIRITDNTGHTTLEEKINEAVVTITKQHFAQGKWPFIGSRIFQFEATGLDDAAGLLRDTARMVEMLEEDDAPIVVLSGALQGGVQ